MGIKYILGFCSCKGCNKKAISRVEFPKRKKVKLCEEHLTELLKNSKFKSITFEETIHINK